MHTKKNPTYAIGDKNEIYDESVSSLLCHFSVIHYSYNIKEKEVISPHVFANA